MGLKRADVFVDKDMAMVFPEYDQDYQVRVRRWYLAELRAVAGEALTRATLAGRNGDQVAAVSWRKAHDYIGAWAALLEVCGGTLNFRIEWKSGIDQPCLRRMAEALRELATQMFDEAAAAVYYWSYARADILTTVGHYLVELADSVPVELAAELPKEETHGRPREKVLVT